MYKAISINYSDLIPYLSSETIYIHFNMHYMGYLNKLNNILSYLNYDYKYSKEELFKHIEDFPIKYRDEIIYNLGGVLNHELYFRNLGLNQKSGNELYDKVNRQYGSFASFKNEFKRNANLLVGSGYIFLVIDKNKDLFIVNLPNQDSPYLYNYIPILALDLWEHAYYLDYKSNRSKYIDDFFSIVDFELVNEEYKKAIKKI